MLQQHLQKRERSCTTILSILPKALRLLYPIRMLVNIYCFFVLIWDMFLVVTFSTYYVLRAIKQTVFPPPAKSVAKEIVLVVGCGRGVGREVVKQMTILGATMVCLDINKESMESLLSEIDFIFPNKQRKIHCYTCDITNHDKVKEVTEKIKREVGNVTMIFHCCGIPSPRALLGEEPRDLNKTFNMTIISQFWILDAFLPSMMKNDHGHIVALTSVAGLSGQQEQLPLSVSQFAVQGLTASLLEEFRMYGKRNIHVTLVHIYPFIMNSFMEADLRLRIPSYFGTIKSRVAAQSIIDAVRRNYVEVSIPRYLLFIGHLLRILPKEATVMIRGLLDTGVDFA